MHNSEKLDKKDLVVASILFLFGLSTYSLLKLILSIETTTSPYTTKEVIIINVGLVISTTSISIGALSLLFKLTSTHKLIETTINKVIKSINIDNIIETACNNFCKKIRTV